MANVKSHSRKSKTGNVHRVGSHYRKNPKTSGRITSLTPNLSHRYITEDKSKTIMKSESSLSDAQKSIADRFGMDFVKKFEEDYGEIQDIMTDDARGLIIKSEVGEFVVFDNYDDAIASAEDDVKRLIDDAGEEVLAEDFRDQFYFISDTDKRLLAQDEANAMTQDEDEDTLKESFPNLSIEDAREKLYDKIYEANLRELEYDPKAWFEDRGLPFTTETSSVQFDIDEASREAVNSDGVAHFLAGYDGDEIEIDGKFLYRVN